MVSGIGLYIDGASLIILILMVPSSFYYTLALEAMVPISYVI